MKNVLLILLILLIIGLALPIFLSLVHSVSAADSEDESLGLTSLLPDIKSIYQKALTFPFKKAEEEIQSQNIKEYYHKLINEAGIVNEEEGKAQQPGEGE